MSRSGLRQLMTTQQMKIQASYLAKYEQVSTLAPTKKELRDAVWFSDITYIWTLEGFVYLTSIMDLYSRNIEINQNIKEKGIMQMWVDAEDFLKI